MAGRAREREREVLLGLGLYGEMFEFRIKNGLPEARVRRGRGCRDGLRHEASRFSIVVVAADSVRSRKDIAEPLWLGLGIARASVLSCLKRNVVIDALQDQFIPLSEEAADLVIGRSGRPGADLW
jgi:hypothetical protein